MLGFPVENQLAAAILKASRGSVWEAKMLGFHKENQVAAVFLEASRG